MKSVFLALRAERKAVDAALTILGVSGIILNVFPFAFDYVPLRDVFPGGWLAPSWWTIVPCMFLPLPIAIGHGVWLTRGPLPRWYSTTAYGVAGLSAGLFLAALLLDYAYDSIAYPVLFLAAFCAVAGLIVGRADRDSRASLVAMQGVYIVQMQFWLVFAAGSFQVGAWLGAATSLAYLAQILRIARRRVWLFLLLAPAAVMSMVLLSEA